MKKEFEGEKTAGSRRGEADDPFYKNRTGYGSSCICYGL